MAITQMADIIVTAIIVVTWALGGPWAELVDPWARGAHRTHGAQADGQRRAGGRQRTAVCGRTGGTPEHLIGKLLLANCIIALRSHIVYLFIYLFIYLLFGPKKDMPTPCPYIQI